MKKLRFIITLMLAELTIFIDLIGSYIIGDDPWFNNNAIRCIMYKIQNCAIKIAEKNNTDLLECHYWGLRSNAFPLYNAISKLMDMTI